ncbi:MAG TPA: peptide deformylase [Syntrophales bacterium]|nr:peptide deformylase [Syntrophales bacterium]
MSKEKILTVWNNEGINEEEILILRGPCADIAAPFNEARKRDIKRLIDAFLALDEAAGLAAPQIGISKRIIIFRNKGFNEKNWSKSEGDYDVLINPRITQSRGELVTMAEGCLSCPEIQVEVSRFPEIKVRAYDQSGRKINKRYTDYLARVVQHEIDHLEGKLIIDHEGAMYIPKERQDFFARIFKQKEPVTDEAISGKL